MAAKDGNDVVDSQTMEKSREELFQEESVKYASQAVETAILECATTIFQKRTTDQTGLVTGSSTPLECLEVSITNIKATSI